MATLKFPSLTFSSFLTQTNRKYTHTWWFVYNLLAMPMQPCQVLKLNMFYRAARQNVRVEHMLSFSLTKDLNLHARNLLRDLLLQFSAVQVHYMHALTYIRNFQEHFPVVFQYVYVRVYIEVNHIQLLYILGSDNLYKLNFTGVGRQNVRWLPSCMCRTISRLGGDPYFMACLWYNQVVRLHLLLILQADYINVLETTETSAVFTLNF